MQAIMYMFGVNIAKYCIKNKCFANFSLVNYVALQYYNLEVFYKKKKKMKRKSDFWGFVDGGLGPKYVTQTTCITGPNTSLFRAWLTMVWHCHSVRYIHQFIPILTIIWLFNIPLLNVL